MINIVAILKVKDRKAFEEFESQAIRILRAHNGELVAAFEPETTDVSLEDDLEVHYIRFPEIENYNSYRRDASLKALSELRSTAIHSTQIYVSKELKSYG